MIGIKKKTPYLVLLIISKQKLCFFMEHHLVDLDVYIMDLYFMGQKL